jgi:hypothetical protein
MAGSGGSDYPKSLGDRGSDSGPKCDTLSFVAPVMSPDPEVARRVRVGTISDVILEGDPRQLAVYVRASGEILGAITEHWADLTSCIDAGFAYEAEVVSVDPLRVLVRPRQS